MVINYILYPKLPQSRRVVHFWINNVNVQHIPIAFCIISYICRVNWRPVNWHKSFSHMLVKMIQPVTEGISLCRVMLSNTRAVHTSVCRMRYKKKWVSQYEQFSLGLQAVIVCGGSTCSGSLCDIVLPDKSLVCGGIQMLWKKCYRYISSPFASVVQKVATAKTIYEVVMKFSSVLLWLESW